MKFLLMFFMLTGFMSSTAYADCSASSSIFDSQDQFGSQDDGFSWCKKRISWWGLDSSDGWKDRFCRVQRYQKNGYDYWRGNFRHEFKQRFRGRNGHDIWSNIGRFYGTRVFQGFNGKISFNFDSRCGYGVMDE